MKLAQNVIEELTQFTQTYWDTYLSGDLETWVTFISDDYRNIGTTKEEVWNSKQEILDYTYSVIDQMIGKVEIRNRKVEIIPYKGYYMVNEVADMYVKGEEGWIFYAPVRLSSLIEKRDVGWVVLHQHGSYPDARTEKGEAFAVDALKAENKKLQAAVNRRTKELETKNNELAIEASLERVRAVAMAIQSPEDLAGISEIVFIELKSLGFADLRNTEVIIANYAKHSILSYYYSDYGITGSIEVDYTTHPTLQKWAKSIKKTDDAFAGVHIKKNEIAYWRKYRKEIGYLPDPKLNRAKEVFYYSYSTGMGALSISSFKPVDKAQLATLERFKNVFGLAYKRYTDVLRAQKQAREAEIELALERIRARALAMHKSSEFAEVAAVLFQQLEGLGIKTFSSGFNIWDKEHKNLTSWMYNSSGINPPFEMPIKPFAQHRRIYDAWQKKESFMEDDLKGKRLEGLYKFLRSFPLLDESFERGVAVGIEIPDRQVHNIAFFSNGYLLFITLTPCEQYHQIFQRFAKVFDQTYTRFLDLQKAEAQAREAQIEAALERVRSRSMAMQKSEELADLSLELVKQVQELGEDTWFCAFNIYDDDPQGSMEWGSNGKGAFPKYRTPREGVFLRYYKAGQQGETMLINEIGPDECPAHYEYLCTLPGVGDQLLAMKAAGIPFPSSQIDHVAYFNYGYILFITYDKVPELHDIFIRFAKVFEQSYTRFLDLQKAEELAREGQIQLGLERVRARTMAMHKSTELGAVAAVLFEQISILSYTPDRFNIGIANKEANTFDVWVTDQKGHQISKLFIAYADQSPVILQVFNAWKSKKNHLVQDLYGKELVEWVRYMNEEVGIPYNKNQVKEHRFINSVFFSHGFIGITTNEAPSMESLELIERFAKVFQQTYIRFLDLQRAEAQTKKATIEVALERVRARALAMQEPEELVEVAQVMRHEMGLLGVEELETSSIYINKDGTTEAECWYALKDIRNRKKKLVADHFALNYQNTWVGQQMLKFYRSEAQDVSIPMKGANRKEWIDYCSQQSTVVSGYYGEVIPERTYHLCKFSNGTIGAATPGEISTESWDLLRRAAGVFSLAYSRFKDLTQARIDLRQLKEEKQRAETALHDLKSTQSQLIQAEKMASLGELTAGIAHEIQNPLNFVNNFSEVNKELLLELQDAIAKGDTEEIKAITNDLLDNEDKVMHHGKRAEGIVKSMLQHSRTSSGEKAMTDLNALADEYLRLAYHGYRAKDKNFNAEFKLELDPYLPLLNVVPQDLGRVLLNLINNAFYVVRDVEKPMVTVKTEASPLKKGGERGVRITVSDNGPGIPEQVREKIFQPFFTTKPTGEGTGLGLSLSYDIIKAHGGELKVETRENEGTKFIILLHK